MPKNRHKSIEGADSGSMASVIIHISDEGAISLRSIGHGDAEKMADSIIRVTADIFERYVDGVVVSDFDNFDGGGI